jgi:hypothetical protein
MKSTASITAGAAMLFAFAMRAMAGSAGVDRPAYQTRYQRQEVLSELQYAQGPARVAAQENKNHPPLINRAHDLDVLISKIEAGEPVSQKEVDDALTPITDY